MKEVSINAKYDDVTFCSNEKCKYKTCYRHLCHNNNPHLVSMAVFEDAPGFCIKKYKEKQEGEKYGI